MFKADGTPIKNPRAFVAGIEKNGYTQPLVDEDGVEIEDPVAFLAELEADGKIPLHGNAALLAGAKVKRPTEPARQVKRPAEPAGPPAKRQQVERGFAGGSASSKASGKGTTETIMWKADGTPIKNPVNFVAGIARHGHIEPIFGADGREIKNPIRYVEAMERRAADGLPDRQPRALQAMERHAAVEQVIPWNVAIVDAPWKRAGVAVAEPQKGAGKGDFILFQADGTPVRNPAAYVAGIEKRGYRDPLYGANGMEIKDPVAWLASIERRKGSGAIKAQSGNNGKGAPARTVAATAPARPVADPMRPLKPISTVAALPVIPKPTVAAVPMTRIAQKPVVAAMGSKPKGIYQADGRPVLHPAKIAAAIEKKGYTQALFDGNGQEIRDPIRYIQGMIKRGDCSA